jgi:hypothetical protein
MGPSSLDVRPVEAHAQRSVATQARRIRRGFPSMASVLVSNVPSSAASAYARDVRVGLRSNRPGALR